MRVKVEEQPTGDFSLGVGYSSIGKGKVTLGLNEKNFLAQAGLLNFQPPSQILLQIIELVLLSVFSIEI